MLLEIVDPQTGQTQRAPIPPGVDITPELVDQLGAAIRAQQSTSGGGLLQGPGAAAAAATAPRPAPGPDTSKPVSEIPLFNAINQQLVQPALDVVRPESSILDRVLGGLAAGSAVVAPELAAIGIGAQTGLDAVGIPSSASQLLAGITELGAGLGIPQVRAAMQIRRGRKLVGNAAKAAESMAAATGRTRPEAVGAAAREGLMGILGQRRAALGQVFDEVETLARNRKLKLEPATAAYETLRDSVEGMVREGIELPGGLGAKAQQLLTAVRSNRRLPAAEIRDFAKNLSGLAKPGRGTAVLDPRVPAFAGQLRGALDDAFQAALPGGAKTRFVQARELWRQSVAEPSTVLRTVLRPNVTPQQAFKGLFAFNEPARLRTAADVAKQSAGATNKLRLGFLEELAQKAGGLGDAKSMKKAAELLSGQRQSLEATGLFTGLELDALGLMFRRQQIPALGQQLKNVLSNNTLRIAGAAGLGAAVFGTDPRTGERLIGGDPTSFAVLALAAAGAPSLRRLLVVPEGGKAAQKLGAALVGQIAQFGRQMDSDLAAAELASADVGAQ